MTTAPTMPELAETADAVVIAGAAAKFSPEDVPESRS